MDYKFALDVSRKNRKIFEKFIDSLSLAQLNKVPLGFKNNIIWNIAHCIVTQQILTYGLSGMKGILPDSMVIDFRKGTKTERNLTHDEINDIKSFLFLPLDQTEKDYKDGNFKNFKPYTVSTGSDLTNINNAITFTNFHEGIHLGYILALKKSL